MMLHEKNKGKKFGVCMAYKIPMEFHTYILCICSGEVQQAKSHGKNSVSCCVSHLQNHHHMTAAPAYFAEHRENL